MPIEVLMPALSPTMTEGNLAKWHVKEGDVVEAGDVIAEIETDKATMEVEAVDEGTVGKILIGDGTQGVAVNAKIAILLEDGENASDIGDVSNDDAPKALACASETPKPKQDSAPVQRSTLSTAAQNAGNRVFASPLAKRIAADKGIDLSAIQGSGPRGRIVKSDVENGVAGSGRSAVVTSSAPVAGDGEKVNDFGMVYSEVPNNNIKKITAKRLTESKQDVPHFYLSVEFQLDALLAARKQMNEQANGEYKISVNDFVIKACAQALQAYPAANVQWSDEATLQFKHSDISIAVATPNGLITPIIKMAETKGLKDISNEMKDLAGRAREGKLKPQEFQGGTFSISNLGMFGVDEFSAIINPPQSCILAVGAGKQKPYVEGGEVKVGTFMKCTLSTDHRTVDGAVGAEFMQFLKRYIENPVSMLV